MSFEQVKEIVNKFL